MAMIQPRANYYPEHNLELLAFKTLWYTTKLPPGVTQSPFLLATMELKVAVGFRVDSLDKEYNGEHFQSFDWSPLIYRKSPWQLSVYVAIWQQHQRPYMEVPLKRGDTVFTFVTRIAQCVRMLRTLSEEETPNSLW